MTQDLGVLSSAFGVTDAHVKEVYAGILASRTKDFPSTSPDLLASQAYSATIATLHRAKHIKIREFNGMFLTCGKLRDFDKREFQRIRQEVARIGVAEAQKKGILNSKGEPIHGPQSKFNAGKPVSNRAFFELGGVILEVNNAGKTVPRPFRMFTENEELLPTVVLNSSVGFSAEISRTSTDEIYTLNDVPDTKFIYSKDVDPNFAMKISSAIYPSYPVSDMLKLMVKEKIKGTDGVEIEVPVIDRRKYLFKDLILTGVYKDRIGNGTTLEFASSALLGWSVYATISGVKNATEPVRDFDTNVYGQVVKIDEEKKEISLNVFGVWQDSSVRPKVPMGDLKPESVGIKFVGNGKVVA